MSETMASYRHDSDTEHSETDLPPMPNLERHVAKASSYPQRVPTIEQFNNNYPQLDPELRALLVPPDPERESRDGITMLAELMEKAPDWILDREYVVMTDEMIEDALVRRIQQEYNVALDTRAIGAARGIVRDAIRMTLYGSLEVPGVKVIGAPMRDDVPSVVAFIGPKPDRRIRHKLLTPDERREYGINTITIKEKKLSKKVLAQIFKADETIQGENHG
ncbi:MAG: hypothetical protein JWO07_717 [Candidatus Saccharibacteria bacterium]|nr:hypothetical protein [Candidatus Saccharibacteria bacterium]